MRTDIPSQGPGRAAAQSSHATSVLEHNHKNHKSLKSWKAQTKYGYGTTIVLGATSNEIIKILNSIPKLNVECSGWTFDPDYVIPVSSELIPFIKRQKLIGEGAFIETVDQPDGSKRYYLHREEYTCAYIMGEKESLAPYLGHLPLYQ